MEFHEGDVVRVCDNDLLRGGDSARVLTVLAPDSRKPIREYVVEFAAPPKRLRNEDRFLCCIYREEQLVRQDESPIGG